MHIKLAGFSKTAKSKQLKILFNQSFSFCVTHSLCSIRMLWYGLHNLVWSPPKVAQLNGYQDTMDSVLQISKYSGGHRLREHSQWPHTSIDMVLARSIYIQQGGGLSPITLLLALSCNLLGLCAKTLLLCCAHGNNLYGQWRKYIHIRWVHRTDEFIYMNSYMHIHWSNEFMWNQYRFLISSLSLPTLFLRIAKREQ